MPELPEVEVVVRSLAGFLVGQRIRKIEVRKEKSFVWNNFSEAEILNVRIESVTRRAKLIDFGLENNLHLLTHLKMTGQLIYVASNGHETAGGGHPTADWCRQLPGSHTRIIYTLDYGKLFFNDQRIFGWMQILTQEEREKFYFSKLGPDANLETFTANYLVEKLKNKRIPIKQALMDNAIVCGLGNIYVAETLFAAGVSPLRSSRSVTKEELERVVIAAADILADSIALGGTTFDGKYVDGQGNIGKFAQKLKVYGREKQPCFKCGQELKAARLNGRATVYCEFCQR